nr:hypothetical protein [Bacillus subtilis]
MFIQGDGHKWVALDYRQTNENTPVQYFDLELNTDFRIADLFNEFLSKLYTYECEDEIHEYDNLDFDEIHTIDLNDPDAIQKEEVEDLEWILHILTENAIGAKGDMGFELADVLMSIVSSYTH